MQLPIWEVKDLQLEYKEGENKWFYIKKDVIDKLSEKTGLYKKDIKAMLVALNELVYEEMDNDNAIILNNLLKIEPVTIPPRNRYDIVRDKVYQHKAYQVVKITPSNNLRDRYRKQNTENEDE